MKDNPVVSFIITTAIGGAVFLVPLVFFGYILYQVVMVMIMIAQPLTGFFPIEKFAGVAVVNIVAVLALILLCFLAGLVARHSMAKGVVKKLDSVLINVPGYAMVRGIKSGFDAESGEQMRPVALQLGSAERIGFEIQQLADGRSMVYIPSAPSAWSGITQILPADQVTYLDIPVTKVMELTEKFGHGVEELLEAKRAHGTEPG
jgi:uncharacterized membrane protein